MRLAEAEKTALFDQLRSTDSAIAQLEREHSLLLRSKVDRITAPLSLAVQQLPESPREGEERVGVGGSAVGDGERVGSEHSWHTSPRGERAGSGQERSADAGSPRDWAREGPSLRGPPPSSPMAKGMRPISARPISVAPVRHHALPLPGVGDRD